MFPWGIIVYYEIDIIGQCCLNIIQCCMIDSKNIDGHSHFGPEEGGIFSQELCNLVPKKG